MLPSGKIKKDQFQPAVIPITFEVLTLKVPLCTFMRFMGIRSCKGPHREKYGVTEWLNSTFTGLFHRRQTFESSVRYCAFQEVPFNLFSTVLILSLHSIVHG